MILFFKELTESMIKKNQEELLLKVKSDSRPTYKMEFDLSFDF